MINAHAAAVLARRGGQKSCQNSLGRWRTDTGIAPSPFRFLATATRRRSVFWSRAPFMATNSGTIERELPEPVLRDSERPAADKLPAPSEQTVWNKGIFGARRSAE